MKKLYKLSSTTPSTHIFHEGNQFELCFDTPDEDIESVQSELQRLTKLLQSYDRLDDEIDDQWASQAQISEAQEEQQLILSQAGFTIRSGLSDKIKELEDKLK